MKLNPSTTPEAAFWNCETLCACASCVHASKLETMRPSTTDCREYAMRAPTSGVVMSGPWTVRETVIVTDDDEQIDDVSPLERSSAAVGGVRHAIVSLCDWSGRYRPLCRYDFPSALRRSRKVSEFASRAEVTAHA